MQFPFTAAQFIDMFTRYNAAIGPMPLVAYALGALALGLVLRGRRAVDAVVGLVLAGMWAFTGIVCHLMYFSPINPAARIFAIAFVIQAVVFAVEGLRGRLHFGFTPDARGITGLVLALWAMVGYPLAGLALGHGYPNGPVFGLTPCPLVIFTLGLLLMSRRAPRFVGIIPVLWAVVGTMAAFAFGIREDLTLGASALVWVAFALRFKRAERLAVAPQA